MMLTKNANFVGTVHVLYDKMMTELIEDVIIKGIISLEKRNEKNIVSCDQTKANQIYEKIDALNKQRELIIETAKGIVEIFNDVYGEDNATILEIYSDYVNKNK